MNKSYYYIVMQYKMYGKLIRRAKSNFYFITYLRLLYKLNFYIGDVITIFEMID